MMESIEEPRRKNKNGEHNLLRAVSVLKSYEHKRKGQNLEDVFVENRTLTPLSMDHDVSSQVD